MAWLTLTQWQTANNLGNLKAGDIMVATRSGSTGGGVIPDDILDTNGNIIIGLTAVASAVNRLNATNAALGNAVELSATGTDTNISINYSSKGTGTHTFKSTATTTPIIIYNGTAYQHSTSFIFANTAANRNVTFQDADGTVAYLTDISAGVLSVTGTTDRITSSGGTDPIIDIAATYVGQTSITTLGTVATGTWNATIVGMTYGGTGANLTPSNGGIVYSNDTTMAVLAGTATAGKVLRSGASTTPAWSTPTFPNTGTSRKMIVGDGTNYVESTETWAVPGTTGNILQSDGTNWISAAPPTGTLPVPGAAGNILQSDGADWTSATPTGTGTPVLATSPALTTPAITTGIDDVNGNLMLGFTATASAVNYINVTNGDAGGAQVRLEASGSSSNISFTMGAKGTGVCNLISANTVSPIGIFTGTGYQHYTSLNFADTAASRDVTFPDASGTVTFAGAASDQETATSTVLAVTPAIQQRHPSSPKAWVLFTSITTTTITSSYNVTSLTDNGTGDTTINFTTAFSADPAMHASVNQGTVLIFTVTTAGTSSYRIVCRTAAGAATDAIQAVSFFGDQ